MPFGVGVRWSGHDQLERCLCKKETGALKRFFNGAAAPGARLSLFLFIVLAAWLLGVGNIVSNGAFIIPFSQLLDIAQTPFANSDRHFVVWELRLPRALLASLVGAALGTAGVIMQSISRNPLGSPSLTGVTSGAALFVVCGVVFFNLSGTELIFCGIVGGYLGASITFLLARQWHFNPIHLTLAGISVSIFASACITVVMILFEHHGGGIFIWLVGSFNGRTWQDVAHVWYWVFAGFALIMLLARTLDILLLDDDTCQSLGIKIGRWRFLLGSISVILTACCVAVAGPISFVGLVAPHIVRVTFNQQGQGTLPHILLLPASALVGASLMAFTDGLSKAQVVGSDLPVGIFSILIGGVTLLYLMRRKDLAT